MSLLVWLPLNGNLENKGITSINTTNTPVYVDGKMGKAISLTSQVTFSGLQKLSNFTIAFWAKVESCTRDWADLLGFTCKQVDDSNAATFRFEATTSSRACFFHNNAPAGISTGSRILIQNYNEWHHVAVSYNGEKLYSYIDGKLTYTDTGLGGYLTSSFWIGESPITGAMNDLRIYDECLSTEQISQISKGLVLHYPLNSGYGNENPIVDSQNFSTNWAIGTHWTKKIDDDGFTYIVATRSGATTNTWNRAIPPYKIIPSNYQDGITVSFDFKCDDYSLLNQKCICSLQTYNSSGTRLGWVEPNVDLKTYYKNGESIQDGIWTRIGYHFTYNDLINIKNTNNSSADVAYTKISFQLTQNGTIYIKKVKIDAGDIMTPWCPNSVDTLYTTLGYNTNIIYNTSGLGNNGMIINDAVYTSNTPLYDSSINLQRANSNYIDLQSSYITNQSTINFWGKVNTFGGWQRFFEFANALSGETGNHRMLLGTYQNTQQLGLHIFGGETGTTSLYVNSNITTIDTNWHMYSIVFNKTSLKVFMDGESIVDTTMTQEITSTIRQYSYIGKSSYEADSYFDGNISDFRIYNTALSVEDIKQLYKSKARIDKNGNMYCNEYIEINNSRELMTSQYFSLEQSVSSEATISRTVNGTQLINAITFGDTYTRWKYIRNASFDNSLILGKKLLLTFQYKVESDMGGKSIIVGFKNNDSTEAQPISRENIFPTTEWQTYVGVVTMGDTYSSQKVYINFSGNIKSNIFYIKDVSLKLYEENKIRLDKRSILYSGENIEINSKTKYKESKYGVTTTNQIFEI